MTNADLADRARQLAAKAPNGSPERKAYGCAAVALSTTGSLAAARKVLAADCPPEVQAAEIKKMQEILYRDSPYLVTAYSSIGEAVRSDRFACLVPQPNPGGIAQAFTLGVGGAIFGHAGVTTALLLAGAWAINLSVAEGESVGLVGNWDYVASLFVIGDAVGTDVWKRLDAILASILEQRPGLVLGAVSTPAAPGLAVKLVAKSAPDLTEMLAALWAAVRENLWSLPVPNLRRY